MGFATNSRFFPVLNNYPFDFSILNNNIFDVKKVIDGKNHLRDYRFFIYLEESFSNSLAFFLESKKIILQEY